MVAKEAEEPKDCFVSENFRVGKFASAVAKVAPASSVASSAGGKANCFLEKFQIVRRFRIFPLLVDCPKC